MNSYTDKERAGSPDSVSYRPGRVVFVTLLGLVALTLVGAGFFIWYIPTVGLANIHPVLPYVLGAVVVAAGVFVLIGFSAIAVSIVLGRDLYVSALFRGLLVKVLFPLVLTAGGLLGIERIRIERAFIDINNRMVLGLKKGFEARKILMLMPHCIKWDDCKMKVTRDVSNCSKCNQCEIAELVGLSNEYGVDLFIATGGTVARRKLAEYRPDAVVAVACERDLSSGIHDAYPLPVLAIVNKRPEGYCQNAGVDIEEVKVALGMLLGDGAASHASPARPATPAPAAPAEKSGGAQTRV
jgi:hypothetical protein